MLEPEPGELALMQPVLAMSRALTGFRPLKANAQALGLGLALIEEAPQVNTDVLVKFQIAAATAPVRPASHQGQACAYNQSPRPTLIKAPRLQAR